MQYLFLLFLLASNATFAIHQCNLKGSISYSNLPCPQGADSREINTKFAPPNDPVAAKALHETNLRHLKQLNKQRQQQEKHHQREIRLQQQAQHKIQKQVIKCKELDLQRKAAKKQLDSAPLKHHEKASIRAQHAENKYELYCQPSQSGITRLGQP